jgi:hypothetical protein
VYVEMSTLKDRLADSGIFLLPRQTAGARREAQRLLHLA